MNFGKLSKFAMALTIGATLAACGNGDGEDAATESGAATESTTGSNDILVDGSSTVFPIMEAVAEEFSIANPDVRATIGVSGTGGGFEKFIAGETDISNASRPIKEEEIALLEEAGIEYTEFQLALDGLTVVVNSENDWVDQLTIEELAMIWTEGTGTETWADVREGWPEEKIELFSPGTDSGTYDYFDEVILDGAQINKAASLSEDDNVLVQGVSGSANAIGYFGYAYFLENSDIVKAVPIVNGAGVAVTPDNTTVQDGSYEPLSRPLFIYVKNESLQNENVYEFTKYTLEMAAEMAAEVGYVALPAESYEEALTTLEGLK
ncbi:PstS family phosphate ABC transporter substrate-binding protein [Trichococcus sp. K1Tr]|jgi:phosphate transport system substrate-binding protein|uniref:PstS family phosphate ABC transporter substrate-binding protein n=1 Tax=Trichococcus sp. K1Tr TaxID=3020847 RepID=UPI00232FC8D2|nr:PstS family phosphate ABC transporter substrate-binding protein [Trichococcus sp. K1Tr]MDB6353238.1 PstS family phosphate ABC transporter substrate-binding protein [Trichococcus sp. K1Tr]